MSNSENPSDLHLGDATPLMKQYWELKAQVPETLLLFRMGDFYELFGEDAIEAARILEITLTTRDRNKSNPMPMAGVPFHSIQGYIQKLLRSGKKVAIGEQMEDPSMLKAGKIVRREITRVFTPGVQFDSEGTDSNYLAIVHVTEDKKKYLLACLDAATGEVLLSEPLSAEMLAGECSGLPIRHLLCLEKAGSSNPLLADEILNGLSPEGGSVLREKLPSNYLAPDPAERLLRQQYGIESLAAFFPFQGQAHALGILIQYVLKTQKLERLEHLRFPVPLRRPQSLVLGPRTAAHLDLFPTNSSTAGDPSVYALVNQTKSALGARQLRRWLAAPLSSVNEITDRQNAIKEIASLSEGVQQALQKALSEVYDLERILGRVNTRLANPRDTLALGRSLNVIPSLLKIFASAQAPLLTKIHHQIFEAFQQVQALIQRIVSTQTEEAPLVTREGGIFKTGTTPELDRLILMNRDGQKWLLDLEARERAATGIASLKVRYNRVFGYYIEVTQAHLKSVPSHYQRKQTMVGAERFFTEELKKFEDEIVNASSRQKALEQELFQQLLEEIQKHSAAIMECAKCLGEVDVWGALARLSQESGWVFPTIDDSLDLEIKAGRHPLVDQAMRGGFVPNDLFLSPETRLTLIITGPNMGGKSTVMRQTALIVILGQMGSPVPAAQARWGRVTSLYTRIGAQDAIARGQSTFMVEMSELAHILHHADSRSLIVLDEIGRGTSTYDGISVAWAALEWICTQTKSRTLFATHYHEITRLSGTFPLCSNAHMAVEGDRGSRVGQLRFLYQLKEGPANDSFGIHVARIAGLPRPVITRAWQVLEELERHSPQAGSEGAMSQLSLFAQTPSAASDDPLTESVQEETVVSVSPLATKQEELLEELRKLEVNSFTPIQALNLLALWSAQLRESSE